MLILSKSPQYSLLLPKSPQKSILVEMSKYEAKSPGTSVENFHCSF